MSDSPPFSPPPSAVEETPPQVSRGLLVLLGVVAGLAALFALWTFVVSPLLSDGADDVATSTPDPVSGEVPDPLGTDSPDGLPGVSPMPMMLGQPVPETFEIFTARDPFQQLVIERPVGGTEVPTTADPTEEPTSAAVSGTAVATLDDAPTSGSGTATTGAGAGATTSAGTAEPEGSASEGLSGQSTGPGEFHEPAESVPVRVALLEVTVAPGGGPALLVRIDEEEHEVVEGQVFAERFWLLDIEGDCASFLFGDSRFTMCEGEEILK